MRQKSSNPSRLQVAIAVAADIFRDGNRHITQALTERLDEIFDDFDGFSLASTRRQIQGHAQPNERREDFTILWGQWRKQWGRTTSDRTTPSRQRYFLRHSAQPGILFDIGAQQKRYEATSLFF